MRVKLVNCDVNYNSKLEGKNTHLKLLLKLDEMMSTKSVKLLAKSGVTSALRRSGNPTSIPASKPVTFMK